jgi:hypothetical protein
VGGHLGEKEKEMTHFHFESVLSFWFDTQPSAE